VPSLATGFFVRKSGVKVFCSRAQPLYFSFFRMLRTVPSYHFSRPVGDGIAAALDLSEPRIYQLVARAKAIGREYRQKNG